MANHKQAEKRNRQRLRRRQQNLVALGRMRTSIKRVRNALAANDATAAEQALGPALQAIGKAAIKGVVHQNTAARYSSRLTRAVNAAQAQD
jgi:small subunit ribosomal protein S20